MTEFTKLCVVGLGYIGLPTAAIFASRGLEVVGVDINKHAVNTINRGEIHIVEPHLEAMVRDATQKGLLSARTVPIEADAFIIAVPTPFKGENHEPDLKFIKSAVLSIAPLLSKGNLIILESTSPVGTTEKMELWLTDARPDLIFPSHALAKSDIFIAYCPERVLPGNILSELVSNDRIIGGATSLCASKAQRLYEVFVEGDCLLASSSRMAEMIKLTENSFRDVNIALANELSLICDDLDLNVWELIELANKHPRVDILKPGPGVGGHCIAVDPWFLVDSSPDYAQLILLARKINDGKPEVVKKRALSLAKAHPEKRVICFGLSFKANIDDLRESPSKEIFDYLRRSLGERVIAIEPNLPVISKDGINTIKVNDALMSHDILVGLVDHKEFIGTHPLSQLKIDAKGLW